MYSPEQPNNEYPQASYPQQQPPVYQQPMMPPQQYYQPMPPQQAYPQQSMPGYPPQGYAPQPGYPPVQQPYPQQQMYYQPQPVIINNQIQMNQMAVGYMPEQHPPMLIRLLYFIFIGVYLGFAWIGVALCFCISIVGLPIGIWMFNRTGKAFFL